MERIKYRISLDMFEVASQTTIKAKKGDTACAIHITLMENRKVYKIDEGCTAFFSAKKPDGNYLFNNETCRIEDNTIIYDFTKQTTPIEGIVECEVILKKDEEKLTSPRFNIKVGSTVYNGEEIISTPEADALKILIDEIQTKLNNGDFVGKCDYALVANAIRGKKSGERVELTDISPLEHNISVKLSGGKEIIAEGYGFVWDYSNLSDETNQILNFKGVTKCSITTADMHGILPYGSIMIFTSGGVANIISNENAEGVPFIPYYNCIIEGNTLIVTGQQINAETGVVVATIIETFEVPEGSLINGVGTHFEGGNNYVVTCDQSDFSGVKLYSRSESGEVTEYTPNADGSVSVKSIYPTTILYTDTEGVNIDATYNQDSTVVMGNVAKALDYIINLQESILG